MIDLSTSALATAGIFFWVHAPEDGLKVLLLQAAGALLSTVIAMYLAYRDVAFHLPRLSTAWDSL
jgi:hypothetical protein